MTSITASDSGSIGEEARDWVLHLASGEADEADLARFRQWVAQSEAHSREFERRRTLWQQVSQHPELFEHEEVPAQRWLSGRWRHAGVTVGAAMAACICGIVGAPEIALRLQADHRTSSSIKHFTLPDGSLAWLDAGSALAVDFTDRERRVTLLRGNVFFTVRHGNARPFRVAALNGTVEDIGTSFEVRREDGLVDVLVTQGAVSVFSRPGADGRVLRRGRGISYDAEGHFVGTAAAAGTDTAAWRNRELLVTRQSLYTVVRQIGRYRSGPTWIWGDLDGGSDSAAAINGAFRLDDPDKALRDLAAAQRFAVNWLPGGIAIVHGR